MDGSNPCPTGWSLLGREHRHGGLHRGGTARHAVYHQHLHSEPGCLWRHHVPPGRAVHASFRSDAVVAVRRGALSPSPDDDDDTIRSRGGPMTSLPRPEDVTELRRTALGYVPVSVTSRRNRWRHKITSTTMTSQNGARSRRRHSRMSMTSQNLEERSSDYGPVSVMSRQKQMKSQMAPGFDKRDSTSGSDDVISRSLRRRRTSKNVARFMFP